MAKKIDYMKNPKLIDLKEKIRKTEKEEDSMESYFIGLIPTFLLCTGLAIFIWYKKILDEKWYYGSGLFGTLALIALILIPFAYKWMKEAEKKVKELEKREKELKDSV